MNSARRIVPLLETFAEHLSSDAKKLVEDEETGAKSYRYIRTGTNHYSLAFTYDWIASEQERRSSEYDTFIMAMDEEDDSNAAHHVAADPDDAERGIGVAAEVGQG